MAQRTLQLQSLDNRLVPAIVATFMDSILTITGDHTANTIVVSRNVAGQLLVNSGAVLIRGATPLVANTVAIRVDALGGNDLVHLDQTNGALPKSELSGGNGHDSLTGGTGHDTLHGGKGNDTLDGAGGDDVLFMGDGNDLATWNPGDGNDTLHGDGGRDTFILTGSNANEVLQLTNDEGRLRIDRNVANIVLNLDRVENILLLLNGGTDTVTKADLGTYPLKSLTIDSGKADAANDTVNLLASNANDTLLVQQVNDEVKIQGLKSAITLRHMEARDSLFLDGNAGNDRMSATNLPDTALVLIMDGGAGNDSLTTGLGNDLLLGGAGNDTLVGGAGNDVSFGGAGNDYFVTASSDGNDVVEGQEGNNTTCLVGLPSADIYNVGANGRRVLVSNKASLTTLDMAGIGTLHLQAVGGSDDIVVGDLSGTDLGAVHVDLRQSVQSAGDGQVDRLALLGTSGHEAILLTGQKNTMTALFPTWFVTLLGIEATRDEARIGGQGGDDLIDARAVPANSIQLLLDGGTGNDVLIGTPRGEVFVGGAGDDIIVAGDGNDRLFWNPGDGSDVFEGGLGVDALLFNGSNASENVALSAHGNRVHFTRNIANILMDLNDVEEFSFNALGGADTMTVHDLTGTELQRVQFNMQLPGNLDDAATDTMVIHGTTGDDVLLLTDSGTDLAVQGLAVDLLIRGAVANDVLDVRAGTGDDVIEASALPLNAPQLIASGGDGDDVLVGSPNDDTLVGNDGDDVLIGGDGTDILDGGIGDDIEIQ